MQNKFFFKLFFILFTFFFYKSSLNADLLTEYRLHGIKNLEKKMDYALTKKNYWYNYLKDIDTTFGYLESYTNILVCDKSLSKLSYYSKNTHNKFNFIQEYSAYTGKIKGDKLKEGDLKTPIGIYQITKKLDKVDAFYGPMAFVTSYPNIYDKYQGKNGSGIWIHGLPTDEKRETFTKGCIAIKNKSIKCLDKHINIDKTLLIIKEHKETQKVSKEDLATILASLYEWRYTWIYNMSDAYLNFYDTNFIHFDGMNLKRFTQYKKRIFNKKETKRILFHNINIIKYPQYENTYEVTFFENYKSNTFSFKGDKTLILKLVNNTIKIITEK